MVRRGTQARERNAARTASRWTRPGAWVVLVIAAVVSCAYWNSLEVPFVFDDRPNISENPHIRIERLDWDELRSAGTKSRALQRPVANATFALNYLAGGDRVRGYHIVNVCIHFVNGLLVYLVALATFRRTPDWRGSAIEPTTVHWISLATALLFVSHPIQTQAVTYLVQRMTSLATLFYLAALLLYIRGRVSEDAGRRWAFWGAGLAVWLLALGTKQNTATLPILVFLYEWYFFRDLSWPWFKRSLVLALPVVAVVVVVALLYLGDSPWERLSSGYDERDFTMGERVLTQFRVLMLYLSLVAWPLPSRFSITHHISTSHSLFDPMTTLLSLLVTLGLLAAIVLTARRHRIISFGIAWVFLHLAVESSVVPLEMAYEHRMYLPLLGISLGVSWTAFTALRNERVSLAVIGALVLVFCLATHQRNHVWNDARDLWRDVLAKYPNDERAYNNLGDVLDEAGEPAAALEAFGSAIRINPGYQKAYVNRGLLYASQGESLRALEDFSRAIDIDRVDLNWWPAYGEAFQSRGVIYLQLGKFEPAIEDLTRAIELHEDDSRSYSHRGMAKAMLGQFSSAVQDGRTAVELDPDSAAARNTLAWFLATAHDPGVRDGAEAIRHATRACDLTEWQDPGHLDTLAAAHAEAGDFDAAIRVAKQAIEIAEQSGAHGLATAMRPHLAAYEVGKPLRDP